MFGVREHLVTKLLGLTHRPSPTPVNRSMWISNESIIKLNPTEEEDKNCDKFHLW